MFKYQLQVTTGQQSFGGTYDYVFLTLIGKEGESERTELKTCFGFRAGTVSLISLNLSFIAAQVDDC